jgi:hypothetical protein
MKGERTAIIKTGNISTDNAMHEMVIHQIKPNTPSTPQKTLV